jgi:hypothetical protein
MVHLKRADYSTNSEGNAIRSLESARNCYLDLGRLGKCGKLSELMAEMSIKAGDAGASAKSLLEASDYYAKENDKQVFYNQVQFSTFPHFLYLSPLLEEA